MSSIRIAQSADVEYPTGDGKPMAETPVHRRNLTDTIDVLERRFAGEEAVYISGNMFVYYEEGNRHRHVSPDVFLVFGVTRRERDCYKTWEEPKATLDLVIEFTSRSTRDEDLDEKFVLYRDRLEVKEYLLFDPHREYLDPPEQLFRLIDGEYQRVEPVDRRLPSKVVGLHFERDGQWLRLHDPETRLRLLTANELIAEAAAENERLRGELERLRQMTQRESDRGGERESEEA